MDKLSNQAAGIQTVPHGVVEPRPTRAHRVEPLLVEIAWEVCNQVGGIYTVLRSKAPSMASRWGTRYLLVGPYEPASASVEFEPTALSGVEGQVVRQMRDEGMPVYYGRWLVTGRPQVVLLDYRAMFSRLEEVKYRLWADHDIPTPGDDELINNTIAFAEMCRQFLVLMSEHESRRAIVAHFHEWMTGAAVPMLRRQQWPGATVFTTHATVLGRYLAMNDQGFYGHLPFYDAMAEAKKFNVEAQHRIERAAAHGAQVFSTVSDVTADECEHLLDRKVDVILPNGLNIQRFAAVHEFQNLHRQSKERIHQFTIGHFFPSYHFDLDNTLYFYTSGRYEYRNKGMDLTIESLARLNYLMQQAGSEVTVVAFIITRRPVRSINVAALQSSAMLREFHTVTRAIRGEVSDKLFDAAVAGAVPDLNSLVGEYWMLRLRRAIHAWKRENPPGIVTHDLVDDENDAVLNQLRACRLWNQQHDRVKVVYHPDFITPTNPLFGMEYDQFVRGCHLGVFPSYYEPWGYTPLESIALGVPAVTSDLAGFGSYITQLMPDHENQGVYVLRRRHRSFDQSAQDLAHRLFDYTKKSRRQRITLRNSVESFSGHFDWHNLGKVYHEAHELALDRVG